MSFMEKINPSYQELLLPLKEWKILNIRDFKQESDYQGSLPSFYKIVRKLEKYFLIDSFVDSWSNEKFCYLLPDGLKVLGIKNHLFKMNRDNRYHDSLVVKVCRQLRQHLNIESVYLDFKIKEKFPFLSHLPDAMVISDGENSFNLAVELELNQKNKGRIREIFVTYSESQYVNNVIFIFNKESVFRSYRKFFNAQRGELNDGKFLFLLCLDLNKKDCELGNARLIHRGREVSLSELFEKSKE